MISKKKLRERVIDICNGAGLKWLEGEQYFDDYSMSAFGRAVAGIEWTFDLDRNNRLRNPSFWGNMETIDDLVDLVESALKFDKKDD